jgi:hypothetical protein
LCLVTFSAMLAENLSADLAEPGRLLVDRAGGPA